MLFFRVAYIYVHTRVGISPTPALRRNPIRFKAGEQDSAWQTELVFLSIEDKNF